MDSPDGVVRTPFWPVAIGLRVQVRLEDRLDHQLGGGLRHTVPNGRDAERALTAAGLGNLHPSHRLWPAALRAQVLLQASQPLLTALGFDLLKRYAVHSSRAAVGLRQPVGVLENVPAPDLVPELIEAEVRLLLRFEIKLLLQLSDLFRRCQTHVNRLTLLCLRSVPEGRALGSPGVTRLPRYYGPVRLPVGPALLAEDGGVASSTRRGLPFCTAVSLGRHAVPTTPADRAGASVGCFPARAAFPVSQAGRRPRFPFRGLLRLTARYGLPACSPGFPRTLSRGFCPADYPTAPLVSFHAYRQLHGWAPSSHRVSAPKRRTGILG